MGEVLQYAYSDGDLSYHVNRYSSNRQDKVQTASILQGTESTITTTISSAQHPPTHHVLHAYGDLIVDAEATKEADNVWRVTLMQHFQLSHNLIAHSWLDVQHDHLRRRKGGREGRRCVTIQAFQFVIRYERCGQWRLMRRADPLPPHILGQLCH